MALLALGAIVLLRAVRTANAAARAAMSETRNNNATAGVASAHP